MNVYFTKCVIGGDLNLSFSNTCSPVYQLVLDFIDEMGLSRTDQLLPSDESFI